MDSLQQFLTLDTRWTSKIVLPDDAKALRGLMIFLTHSCDSWFWIAGLGLAFFLGNGELRIEAIFWVFGIVILGALVLLIKAIIRRPRPEGEWGKIYRIADPHSFPSGHAARAMGLAILAIQTGSGWRIAGMLLWAVLVGISRIALKLHYLSDVVAGWLLGAVGGLLALQLYPWFTQYIKALLS